MILPLLFALGRYNSHIRAARGRAIMATPQRLQYCRLMFSALRQERFFKRQRIYHIRAYPCSSNRLCDDVTIFTRSWPQPSHYQIAEQAPYGAGLWRAKAAAPVCVLIQDPHIVTLHFRRDDHPQKLMAIKCVSFNQIQEKRPVQLLQPEADEVQEDDRVEKVK